MLKLDPDNPLSTPVQTRDGRRARIICVDAAGERPIVSLITREDGNETSQRHLPDGTYTRPQSKFDLINIPQRRTVEVYAYAYDCDAVRTYISEAPNLRLTFENDRLIAAEVIG